MRISGKRLALGAGVAALIFGALAPLANASSHLPQVPPVCQGGEGSSDTPGEGMIVVGATNGPAGTADISCWYASTAGAATTYNIASLNEWELTDQNGDVIASQANVFEGAQAGDPQPKVSGSFTSIGGPVTLTVFAACAEGSECGASVQAVVGSTSG